MNRNPILLYKILIVGVIVLILGFGIQPAFASAQSKCIKLKELDYLYKDYIILDSFHDVGIKNITSPKTPYPARTISNVPEVCIQLGTEDIDVNVVNNGTFPELDLTCYAEIYEYITDPENGILVYEDEITDIDLEEPNGSTKLLNFDDFTFANEGIYELILDLPLENDEYPDDNHKELIIGVDDTDPETDYPPILDPADPDGENDWYVSNITVTLNAFDPWSNEVSSGVKEIRYTVNGGAQQVLSGNYGSFILSAEGSDILVEYWAVDRVGNVESPKNSFTIDIDKTPPETDLTYEIVSGNWLIGWDFLYCFMVGELMSGVNVTYYRIDNGEWMIYTEPFTLHGHEMQIEYYSIDNAGNVEDIKSSNVTISSTFFLFKNLKLLNNFIEYIGIYLIIVQ